MSMMTNTLGRYFAGRFVVAAVGVFASIFLLLGDVIGELGPGAVRDLTAVHRGDGGSGGDGLAAEQAGAALPV